MPAQSLKRLQSENIIKRTVYFVVPPKTEYNLTAFGVELIDPLEVMAAIARLVEGYARRSQYQEITAQMSEKK